MYTRWIAYIGYKLLMLEQNTLVDRSSQTFLATFGDFVQIWFSYILFYYNKLFISDIWRTKTGKFWQVFDYLLSINLCLKSERAPASQILNFSSL